MLEIWEEFTIPLTILRSLALPTITNLTNYIDVFINILEHIFIIKQIVSVNHGAISTIYYVIKSFQKYIYIKNLLCQRTRIMSLCENNSNNLLIIQMFMNNLINK